MSTFFHELRRRNVVKVGVAYAITAWIVVEIASVVLPIFKAPEWILQVFTLLIILGFPLALVFSWAFEITPEGLKREHEVDRSQSITGKTGRKLDFAIIGLLAVGLAISVFLNLRDDGTGSAVETDLASDHLSIAVLPFTSRSTDPENALFADGIHDDLLTTLAKIGSLKVISRTSVMEYRDTTKNLKEIGNELGVANVMEGAVQKFGNSVRINVQLIDADTDKHLWAETYDRELTTRNLFAIQTEISNEIASALKTTLTPEEQTRIAAVRTENLEAYNLYLTARNHMAQRRIEDLNIARQQFARVIELDPGFADAYSGLADSIMLLQNNFGAITWEEAKERVVPLLQKGLSLDGDNALLHASSGLFRLNGWTRGEQEEYPIAEVEAALEHAIELNPNYAQPYFWLATAKSAQDLYEDAITLQEKALELDPLARIPSLNLGSSYADLGRNQDATNQWLKTADLHADYPSARMNLARHLMNLGRFDEGLAWALEGYALDSANPSFWVASAWNELGYAERAAAVLESMPAEHPWYKYWQSTIAQLNGDSDKAYALLRSMIERSDRQMWFVWNTAANFAIESGDYETARDYLLAASPELADRSDPDVNWQLDADTVLLAFAAKQLGEEEYADLLVARTLAMLPGRPRLGFNGYGIWDARLYAVKGDMDTALAKLREAVDAGWRGHGVVAVWPLAEDPLLATLREEPEFQAILAEVEADLARQRARVDAAAASGDWQPLLTLARQTAVADASK